MVIGIQGILFLFSILLSSFSVSFSFSAVGSEVRKSLFCNTNQYEGFLTPFSDTAAHTSRTDHSRISMKVSSGLKSDSIVYTSKAFQIRYANRDDFNKVAYLLADEMYGGDPIPKGQRNELVRLEEKDMRDTYGKKQYTSKLLLAEDINDNTLIGCVGVNTQAIDMQGKKLTAISSWTNTEDEVAVLANLVVRRGYRKKGIAKELGKQVEDQVKEWGIDRVALTVNKDNTPAFKLYKKLGYKVIFEDSEATCVLPGEYNLFTSPCINLCMVKKLKGGSGGGQGPLSVLLNIGLFKK